MRFIEGAGSSLYSLLNAILDFQKMLKKSLVLFAVIWQWHPSAEPMPEIASRGVASSAHPLATQAAEEIYALGGNSVDAAIAASFVLSVVEPTMSGLGGRSLAMVRTSDGEFYGYDGMTEIPKGFAKSDSMPSFGYSTVATPGTVATLGALHKRHGRLDFNVLLQPAIRLSIDGFQILPGEAARQGSALEKLKLSHGMTQLFVQRDGNTATAGELLKQPALAETLRRIAQHGYEEFYTGDTGKMIAQDMVDNGGYVTLEDLNEYRVLPARYIAIDYRGYTIHTVAAPGGGGLVAKALLILDTYDLSEIDDHDWAVIVSQAIALSIESMQGNYYEEDLEGLLDRKWAIKEAMRIYRPAQKPRIKTHKAEIKASDVTDWIGYPGAHTSHLAAQDCSGLTISMTQTIGPIFGAKVATPELGFVYAATMGGYLRTGPQEPGARPRTAIAPVIVTKNNKVVLSLGAAGGIRIPSAIVQIISRFIDQKHTLADALALPRVHPSVQIGADDKRVVRLMAFDAETSNPGWTSSDIRHWRSEGFEVTEVSKAASFGRVNLVAKRAGLLMGETDPDWEGQATGRTVCP